MIKTKRAHCPHCNKELLGILRFCRWYVDCPVCYEETELYKEVDDFFDGLSFSELKEKLCEAGLTMPINVTKCHEVVR